MNTIQKIELDTAKLLINGQFIESKTQEWQDIVNPATQEVIGRVPFASLEATDVVNGTKSKLDMPVTSNVLQYFSADGSKVSIRPSGTEPKIKFYIEVRGIKMDNYADYDAANAAADAKIEAIKKELGI